MNRLFPFAALAAAVAAAPPSSAIVFAPLTPASYVFRFEGSCSDCAAPAGASVTATLRVKDYILDRPFTRDNFVSFTYDGTNLVAPFTLTSVDYLTGSLNAVPGAHDVAFGLDDGSYAFRADALGDWALNTPTPIAVPDDRGTRGVWRRILSESGSDVPEPASWALMIAGFGLVGGAMRRQARVAIACA